MEPQIFVNSWGDCVWGQYNISGIQSTFRVSEFVKADLPLEKLRDEYGQAGFDSKRRKTFLWEWLYKFLCLVLFLKVFFLIIYFIIVRRWTGLFCTPEYTSRHRSAIWLYSGLLSDHCRYKTYRSNKNKEKTAQKLNKWLKKNAKPTVTQETGR